MFFGMAKLLRCCELIQQGRRLWLLSIQFRAGVDRVIRGLWNGELYILFLVDCKSVWAGVVPGGDRHAKSDISGSLFPMMLG